MAENDKSSAAVRSTENTPSALAAAPGALGAALGKLGDNAGLFLNGMVVNVKPDEFASKKDGRVWQTQLATITDGRDTFVHRQMREKSDAKQFDPVIPFTLVRVRVEKAEMEGRSIVVSGHIETL